MLESLESLSSLVLRICERILVGVAYVLKRGATVFPKIHFIGAAPLY